MADERQTAEDRLMMCTGHDRECNLMQQGRVHGGKCDCSFHHAALAWVVAELEYCDDDLTDVTWIRVGTRIKELRKRMI